MSTEDTVNLIGLRLSDQCSDCDRTRAALLDLGVYLKRCIACNCWVCRECTAHHWRGRVQFSCGHEPITVITPEPPIEAGMHLGCPTCGQKAVLDLAGRSV